MGKTVNANATKQEKEFFENFPSNANLSDKEADYLQYGFFHFTPLQNLKSGKDGKYETSIEQKGLNADIGANSKGFEREKRAYFSIGSLGVCGIINRLIFLSMQKFQEQGLPLDEAKQKAFETAVSTLGNAVYLKLNIRDGIEYDSNDFMTQRNSHTIAGIQIPPEKLSLLSVNGSSNALDVFEYFYQNTDISKVRLSSNEENFLDEFMKFAREKEKDSEPKKQILSPLTKLELGKEQSYSLEDKESSKNIEDETK